MNKVYLKTTEIINLKVAGIPSTPRGLIHKADREGWVSRKASGRGGGLEYQLSYLPKEIQDKYQAIHVKKALEGSGKRLPAVKKAQQMLLEMPVDDQLRGLDQKQIDQADARMVLVQEVLKVYQVTKKIKEAAHIIVAQVKSRKLDEYVLKMVPIANAKSGGVTSLSHITLYRWVLAYRKASTVTERMLALAPEKPNKETNVLSCPWLPDFLDAYRHANKPTLVAAYRDFSEKWLNEYSESPMKLGQLPSLDQVSRAMKKLPKIERSRGRITGSAFRAMLPYVDRDWSVLKPNDVWVGDGHGFKALVASPITGKPYKPEFTAIIDGHTKKIMGWSVSASENMIAVSDAFRIGVQHNGLPLIYYSDNGGGQKNKSFDADVTGLFSRLDVDHTTGIPGNPQGRGAIERLWQTIAIPLAKKYDTYMGQDADEETARVMKRTLVSAVNAQSQLKPLNSKQEKALKKLPSFRQFIEDLTDAVNQYNSMHEHSELPKNGHGRHYTPNEYWHKRWKEEMAEPDFLTSPELDFMFRPEVERVVSRGIVEFLSTHYFSVDLSVYHGEKVRVSYDVHDPRDVIVKKMDGTFICKAVAHGNRVDAFPKSYIEHVQERRTKGQLKRLNQKIDAVNEELNPAIEHMPDYGALLNPIEPRAVNAEPIFLTAAERDEYFSNK